MRQLRSCSLTLASLLLVMNCPSADAEDDPAIEMGIKPYGSYHMGDIDNVNLSNGSLGVDIPLISYTQRGGRLALDFSLHYFNGSSYADYVCYVLPIIGQVCNVVFGGTSTRFAVIDKQALTQKPILAAGPRYPCIPWDPIVYSELCEFDVFETDGAAHEYFPTNASSTTFRTADASGISGANPGGGRGAVSFTDSKGIVHTNVNLFGVSDTRTDSNGNAITYSSSTGWTDTMGRVIPVMTWSTNPSDFAGCTGSYPTVGVYLWNPPGINGGTYPLKFCSTVDLSPSSGTTWMAGPITSVVLPNNTAWTFDYTLSAYSFIPIADLTRITFPTGGTLSYGWTITNFSNSLGWNEAVATRTLNPNDAATPASQWSYSYSGGGSGGTVTDPGGNTSVHLFGPPGYENQVKYYQGSSTSGTLLKTVNTAYSSTPTFYGSPSQSPLNVVPIQVDTIWANGQQNRVTYTYDSPGFIIIRPEYDFSGLAKPSSTLTAIYGKLVAKREYDYGSGAPGALMRTTTKTYLALNNSTYLNYNLLDLPSSVQIKDGGGAQRAYTTYSYDGGTLASSGVTMQHVTPPNGTYRGNLTSVARWLNTTGSYLTGTNTYFDTGMVNVAKDPKLNPTTFGYSTTYQGAYPTTVTNALNQSATNTYDFNTGLLASTTDPNSQTTSYQYDQMFRTTQINRPEGGQVTFSYPTTTEVDISEKMDTRYKTASLLVDGVGRKIRQISSNGESTPYDQADVCYDGNGRVSFQSYAYQGNGFSTARVCSGAGDSFVYDAFGRPKTVTHSDSSVISTSYTGNSTTVTDEQGKNRKSVADGMGRLTQVVENPGGLNYTTTYTYDALDNLTGVTQAGSRQRTFVYDSLSRLTSSTNPESNWAPATQTNVATTYAYDANGNLVNKTGPAPNQQSTATVTLTYCYDALNRLTAKGYTAQTCSNGWLPSPVATYIYDGGALPSGCSVGSFSYGLAIGRRTAMCDAAGSEAWSYNIVSGTGWQIVDQRKTNSVTKSTTYQNNLLGLPVSVQYPSGRTVNYAHNLGARPISATDGTTSVNYANSVHYWAGGAPCWAAYGGAITSAGTYNARLQPLAMQATTNVVPFTTCAGLGQTGNLLDFTYNFNLGSGDNGNVMGITNNRDTTRSQAFTYDALNRLLTAQTTSTYATSPAHCWGENFRYDNLTTTGGAWGNLTSIGVATTAYNGCTQENLSVTASAQNRISTSGYLYDTAGNMTAGPPTGTTYTYNAENQLTATAGVTYSYDGDGKRVQKSNGKLYWYGMDGSVLDETDLTGSTTNSSFNEFVIFGGKRIARRDSSNNVFYYAADHLGTSRVIAQVPAGQTTGTLCYDADFYPFGGERTYTNTCSQNYKFTGKERDTESGLDNFGARYHGSSVGRFTSADPKVRSGLRMLAPQLWNMYVYAGNNPLKYYDPDGMELRLAPGLDKKTQDRIINDLAKTYRTPAGRAGLQKMDESAMKFTLGTASLPDNKREDGRVGRVYGRTEPHLAGSVGADGKAVVDQSQSSVKIEYDFKKLDNSGPNGPSEKTVFDHELGHGVDIATDPVAERNKTDAEAGAAADKFQEDVSRDKKDMSMDAAKDEVQRMLNPPPPPPKCDRVEVCGIM